MITRRTWAGRVALLASVPALALVTLAAGCGTVSAPPSGGPAGGSPTASTPVRGTPSSTPSPATPTAVPTITGGRTAPGQPDCANWPAKVAHVPLPTTFTPVAVLRCVTGYQTIPGKGQWQTATLERATTDLAPLTAALRKPPAKQAPGHVCPFIAMVPPQIVLIDGAGKMIIPRLPVSGCGLVQSQVLAALNALPWSTVSVRLVAPMETQAEVNTGCTPGYKDPFLVYASARPSPGGVVYSTPPSSLRICVYSAAGAATGAAEFQRGTVVTGAVENNLLTGLTRARRTALCGLPHASFAVVGGVGPGTPVVFVELGGCYRVLRYQTGTGGLTDISTGQASSQAVAIIESVTRPKP